MTTSLVHGRTLVRGIGEDGAAEEIADGALLIRDGVITDVGPREALAGREGIDAVIGGGDFVVFPGLVNAHHHVGLTPLQLGSPDLPLELWVTHRLGARRVDLYLDTLYSAFEMVRSGVTTVQHLHGRVPGGVDEVCAGALEVIRAYREIGMRVSYSYGLREQNRVVYEPDSQFLARLPVELARRVETTIESTSLGVDENLAVWRSLGAETTGEDRVALQLAPLNFQWCSDTSLEAIEAASRAHETPIHMHLLETAYQRAYARRRTGGSALDHLDALGLLDGRMTLGHGTWTTAGDLDRIAERGVRVCHNCSSNQRLMSGTAPVNAMLERGIEVAIGIDEAGMNDDRDMLLEMRQVLRQHRVPGHRSRVPTPAQVLRMATEHGAASTGFGAGVGRLDPGRAGDVVLARWSRITGPFLDPDVPVVDALVQRAKPDAIDTVLVAGEVVLDGGRFARVDEDAVLADLSEQLAVPLDAGERDRRAMARELLPYVRAFYADWLDGEPFDPYDHRNSAR